MSGDHNQFQKGKSYLDEPVAWMHTTGTGHVYFRKKPQDKVFNPQPVYTSPKREWVRLTEKEVRAMAKPDHGAGIDLTGRMWVFIADLTDKLKEKNHGDQSQAEGAQ